ncbi:hypothetical protein QYM36_011683 [Artemia franciscana]|uniref:glutathione peroxidase n=1 Tax=Artemia franciscana TaxID=6661 RepID=A0AA88HY07_ARTSF|nr:hypothetical protein QYM36_011683 [Artemia franciscana]
MLIVPIASFSEDTYQVVELNALHNNYQFLEVLAFPTKQFGHDEPAANGTEVMNELSHVRPGNKFKPHFHLFNIVDVNGRSEHPLFKFLKNSKLKTANATRALYFCDGFKKFDKIYFSTDEKLRDVRKIGTRDHCIPTRDEFANVRELNYSPLKSKDIRWNFEKFLINKHGHPIIRYDSKSRIGDIKKDVEHDYFS